MKLRLQLVEMLSTPPKPGADEAQGVSFGAAMEKMMATAASGQPSLVESPPAMPGKHAQTGVRLTTARPDPVLSPIETRVTNRLLQAGESCATVPRRQGTEQNELLQGQGNQNQGGHPGSKFTSPSEEPPTEEAKQTFHPPMLLIQSPAIEELRPNSQSLADATSSDAMPVKDASSYAKRKTQMTSDEPSHTADGQASGTLPAISQPFEVVVPIPTLTPEPSGSQADGLSTASLKSSSKSANSRAQLPVHGPDALHQAPVSATAFNHGDSRGTFLATPGRLAMPEPQGTANGKSDKLVEPVSSNREDSTKTQLAPHPIENANASMVPPNQVFHPQAAPAADGAEGNAKQSDTLTPKDAGRKIDFEVKPGVRLNAAGYPPPTQPEVHHQASPNIAPALSSGAEKAITTHRPEASAAQVLQRMDLASSSGAVQLRADARRLDVGVPSGTLGWVEVKATTSASGRVDATLHVQNDVSAQVLTSQSREISDYAREHSVQLGQVSVGVGTGDSAQGQSHFTHARNGSGARVRGTAVQPLADAEQTHHAADAMSLISVRA